MKYIKMFEAFITESRNYSNHGVKNLNLDYGLPDLEEKKAKLNELFPHGCVDSDHYKLFGYESEDDFNFGNQHGEIDNDRIVDSIKDAVQSIFPGFEVECSMYSGDESCSVIVRKGEDSLAFDLDVDVLS